MEDIIGKIFKQNCGDFLFVIEKTNQKNKNGNYLFRCQFQKYPLEILADKRIILKGQIVNPEIERVEFLEKIWPQHCGDFLKIIKKTSLKDNSNHHYLYKCKFIQSGYEVLVQKGNILKGTVLSPQIEEDFIKSIWQQSCGDALRVIEKTEKQNSSKEFLYKCEFLKCPCIVYKTKSQIKNGHIGNPEINNIINKVFIQKSGDKLKVLRQVNTIIDANKRKIPIYECEFENQEYKFFAQKGQIKSGIFVDKARFVWNYADKLEKYLIAYKGNFSLEEIAESLQITPAYLGRKINEFGLRKYIKYSSNLQQESFEKYIGSLIKDKIETNKALKDREGKTSYEIDVYISKFKIGFEYNGNYWHSNAPKFGKVDYLYHQKKTLLAKENNIKLFHIWEWEWQNEVKHYLYEAYIKSKLGIFDKKIGARQCQIKKLSVQEYENFCEYNHIQGKASAKIKLGLFYKEELIQVMSFSLPRFCKDIQWEIIRECSKVGWCIIGGKERLWSYFIKNYNPISVITYCDYAKFLGTSYIKLGFRQERLNRPGFLWWDCKKNEVYWRNPYKNKEMKEKGYLKLFDVGQLVFVWQK